MMTCGKIWSNIQETLCTMIATQFTINYNVGSEEKEGCDDCTLHKVQSTQLNTVMLPGILSINTQQCRQN